MAKLLMKNERNKKKIYVSSVALNEMCVCVRTIEVKQMANNREKMWQREEKKENWSFERIEQKAP